MGRLMAYVLAGVVLFFGLIATAIVLLLQPPTWADKQEEMTAELRATFPSNWPDRIKDPASACMGRELVKLAAENGCPLDNDKPALVQFETCVTDHGLDWLLRLQIVSCAEEVKQVGTGTGTTQGE